VFGFEQELQRGPVTGLSKRMNAWRKRSPSAEGRERAADEINLAVGQLEGMQMDISDQKYYDTVDGVKKERKPNSMPVINEHKLNQTLSSFGRKQRATDIFQVC